jgi:hypothetical protein
MTHITRDQESCNVNRASCAYRHCKETFRPTRSDHRFCSQRCREAYAYDLKRVEAGVKGPRKKRLQTHVTHPATPLAGSVENAPFYSSNSTPCKSTQPLAFRVPLDVLGRGHRWPAASSIDQRVVAEILRRELCAP